MGTAASETSPSRRARRSTRPGRAAFNAALVGTIGGSSDNGGVFLGDGQTGLVLIARKGAAAPDGNGHFSQFSPPALNDAGQVMFAADLGGTSGGSSDNSSICLSDPALGLVQVAREGDALLGSTVTSLFIQDSTGNRGHEGSGLNELGQIAYRFTLADGRIGVAIVSVPEPQNAALALTAVSVLLRLRSRRASRTPRSSRSSS